MVTTGNGTGGGNTADSATADSDRADTRPGDGIRSTEPAGRLRRMRGGLVTIGTVTALVAAMGLTVLGLGVADNAVASYDASAWLWSAAKSEIARVNGITGRVDTRVEVPQARSHPMQVTQTDRFLILRDLNTGQVSSLDLATLQVAATTKTNAGLGVTVALHQDAAFVVDAVQGVVRQLDPRSLVPVGEPVRYPPGITGGFFDGEGRLWLAVPSEGTVSAITAAALPSDTAPAGGSGAGLSPQQVQTVAVAAPSHDLAISTLDSGVAVLDRTTSTLTTVRGDDQRTVPLTIGGSGTLPPRTNGPHVPVTVPDTRHVYVVGDGGAVQRFAVPGAGNRLRPAVAWAGRFYCTDEDTGTVYEFDAAGTMLQKIEVPGANGPLELEVRENHLFINAPNSSTARVIDDKHQVRVVDKYADDVLGGDPPPVPPPPQPKKPKVGKPGAPRSVTAAAGNAQVRVSWRPAAANGAEIIKYVVAGDGKTYEVGANQRSLEVTGLTNGRSYRFSVHAVNAKGAGPERTSKVVVPTSEVPDAPASVTAQERPDGTVLVRWPAANGQGYGIAKYQVNAVSAGATAPVGEAGTTELVVPAGELEYGTQYAFNVVAVNEKGAGSTASPVSNTVVPFTLPGKPTGLSATTMSGEAGAIAVVWAPSADNGRPVTRYVVSAGGRTMEVTDTRAKITGLGDGQSVTVKVHAVNEAGAGPDATDTARTVAPPQVTITGSASDATSVTVNFTVNAGGGQAQCTLAVAGAGSAGGSCGSLRVGSLFAGTSYNFTVTATNAAGSGSATGSRATAAMYGIATCNNGASGDTASYCDADLPDAQNGNEIFSVTRQDYNRQVGWAKPDSRLRAYCKKQGQEVYAYIYNNHKRSTWWIKVDTGAEFIPWAWLNLENGDNINALPTC